MVKAMPEIDADVVVVGYSCAGATAAISAYDAGARVLVLEKLPTGGGNTPISGGAVITPTSIKALKYFEALFYGTAEKKIIRAFVKNALQTKDWVHQIGGEAIPRPDDVDKYFPPRSTGADYSNVPGAEYVYKYNVREGGPEVKGEGLWKVLSTAVEHREIKVMTNSPAKELITDEKGAVIGLVAEKEGDQVLVKAKKAVILTCGGFEYNDAMKEAFLPCKPFYADCSPGNTGDGIIMVQKVGAALWHMNVVVSHHGFKAPGFPASFQVHYRGPGYIHVNRQGKRFSNETGREPHDSWRDVADVDDRHSTSRPGYLNIPLYGIFDEETRLAGPMFRSHVDSPTGYNRYYKWSKDNSEEIAKGWITQGHSISEIANRLSIDASSLENTVAKYNKYCKAGKDADFGRSKETLKSIETPPFYAIELWPSMHNTQGGPRRDELSRVLDHQGKPIPRLYAAGEFGSIWGFMYNGGGNLSECLAFGRIAGRNAAREKPWL